MGRKTVGNEQLGGQKRIEIQVFIAIYVISMEFHLKGSHIQLHSKEYAKEQL